MYCLITCQQYHIWLPTLKGCMCQVRLFVECFNSRFTPLFYKVLRRPEHQDTESLRSVMKVSMFRDLSR